MRVKCRGYEGNLICYHANEVSAINPVTLELIRDIPSYDISILTDDGAVVDLECVKKSEIEVSVNHMEGESKMKVSYKGVTGELLKLELYEKQLSRVPISCIISGETPERTSIYNLEIWDDEKAAKISFSGVSLKDVKFLGGEVSFG